jgi:RNA polymerase primary sigma factor
MARPKKSDQTAEKETEEFISANMQEVSAEERRTRLKSLIVLGKERGYLTYA